MPFVFVYIMFDYVVYKYIMLNVVLTRAQYTCRERSLKTKLHVAFMYLCCVIVRVLDDNAAVLQNNQLG